MTVVDLSISKRKEIENKTDMVGDAIRDRVIEFSKDFKTSWVGLGQSLYAVHQDKLYHAWGFEKFEDYTEEEVGLKKSLCMKLLKAYLFIETDEPTYLSEEFQKDCDAVKVPGYDVVDVLRLARSKKELMAEDYSQLRKSVFDKGSSATEVRKEMTAMMKERKEVDPDEERDERNEKAIKKVVKALENFKMEMDTLKLLPDDILEDAKSLLNRLAKEIPEMAH